MTQSADFDTNAFFRQMRTLDETFVAQKLKKPDRVQMLIIACIINGVNTGRRIVGVLVQLGFNDVHVRTVLAKGISPKPEWLAWGKNREGVYFTPERPPVIL